jgi:hypothetical protein
VESKDAYVTVCILIILCFCYIKSNMVSHRIKDNRQRNLPPNIEVTNEDKVRVRFNGPWIEMVRVK